MCTGDYMEFNIHKEVSELHFNIAEKYDKIFREESDIDKKKINMVVAAQNYFYSSINAIEAVFARDLTQHSFNHENRFRKLIQYRTLFSDEIVSLFEKVDRDQRNKVAYRGENGKLYKDIKDLAKLLMEKKWLRN